MATEKSSLLSFSGRIGRARFAQIAFGVPLAAGMFLSVVPDGLLEENPAFLVITLVSVMLGLCGYLYVLMAAVVKRLRDVGKEPYMIVIMFLPLANLVFYLYLSLKRAADDTSKMSAPSLFRGAAKATAVIVLMFVIQVAFVVISKTLSREFGNTQRASVTQDTNEALSPTSTSESLDQGASEEVTYY